MFNKTELLKALCAAEKEEPTLRVRFPDDIVPRFLLLSAEEAQELFMVALLDGAHGVIDVVVVTKGLVNRTLVHPREVFREAIRRNAVAVILGHNHPSGGLEPSAEDEEVTQTMKIVAEI